MDLASTLFMNYDPRGHWLTFEVRILWVVIIRRGWGWPWGQVRGSWSPFVYPYWLTNDFEVDPFRGSLRFIIHIVTFEYCQRGWCKGQNIEGYWLDGKRHHVTMWCHYGKSWHILITPGNDLFIYRFQRQITQDFPRDFV